MVHECCCCLSLPHGAAGQVHTRMSVIIAFLDHTHLLYETSKKVKEIKLSIQLNLLTDQWPRRMRSPITIISLSTPIVIANMVKKYKADFYLDTYHVIQVFGHFCCW